MAATRAVDMVTGKSGTCLRLEQVVLSCLSGGPCRCWKTLLSTVEDDIASGHYGNAVIRRSEMSSGCVTKEVYATGGGALARRSHLLQSLSSRLRHERMHQPVPICPDVIFGTAAGRHKLSDTDSLLEADHDGCRSPYLCRGCPAGQLMTR
jgi:hypothetical protein